MGGGVGNGADNGAGDDLGDGADNGTGGGVGDAAENGVDDGGGRCGQRRGGWCGRDGADNDADDGVALGSDEEKEGSDERGGVRSSYVYAPPSIGRVPKSHGLCESFELSIVLTRRRLGHSQSSQRNVRRSFF